MIGAYPRTLLASIHRLTMGDMLASSIGIVGDALSREIVGWA